VTVPAVWTVSADGSEAVTETFGFLTDVMRSYGGFEQREQLREVALETFEFSILSVGREAQLADGLIYGYHADAMIVPLWQYGSPLTAAVAPGDHLLPIADALSVPYRRSVDDGGYALVWHDAFAWELFEVSAAGAGGVTTVDAATAAWAAGFGYVFPARLARLTDRQSVRWLTSTVLQARLAFTAEQT
jgi:hypothetical protein